MRVSSTQDRLEQLRRKREARERRLAQKTTKTTTTETNAMARSRSSTSAVVLNEAQKRELIQKTFPEILSLKKQIAALMAQHVDPVKRTLAKTWKDLKTQTESERKDLDLAYRIWERDVLAGEMDDDTDRERIRENLRRTFQALQAGDMLSFLDALEELGDQLQEDMFEQTEAQPLPDIDEDAHEPEPAPLDAAQPAAATERTEPEGAPGADWAEGNEAPADDDLDAGGHAFNDGRTAGLAGHGTGENPHDKRSTKGKLWEKGRVAGASERTAAYESAVDEGATARREGMTNGDNPYAKADAATLEGAKTQGWAAGWETEDRAIASLQAKAAEDVLDAEVEAQIAAGLSTADSPVVH